MTAEGRRVNGAVAMDVGGGHVSAALVDLTRREVWPDTFTRAEVPSDADAAVILRTWAQAALTAHAAGGSPAVRGVGLALPAPFDYATGISRMTHKFSSLYGLNVVESLRTLWADTGVGGVPVRCANDADLFALGEWWGGSARGHTRLIGVTLGSGLGSGFLRDGCLVTQGEEVPPGGELWNTPYLDGVAEDYACGAAVSRAYERLGGGWASAAEVARQAARQDDAARAAFGELGAHLAGVLRPWVSAFRPSCVVVGGNVARAWPLFVGALQEGLPDVVCCPTTQFEVAAVLGGAALVERVGHTR